MSSKRMSISALLSSNASSSSQPPSPALPPASDEPPPKRQRQHNYNQQYYDSYNAYPYSASDFASQAPRYHPQHQQSRSPRSASPRAPPSAIDHHTWVPQPVRPQSQQNPRAHWNDGLRYAASNNSASFDFAQSHRQTSNLRGAEDDIDGVERGRDMRYQPSNIGRGQSLASVLTDQMRAPQTHTALPAPPQLRRDAQHSHQSYSPTNAVGTPPLAPIRTRDTSPLAAKVSTPRTSPPSLSPRSSYTSQIVSPTGSYSAQNVSPTTYAPMTASSAPHPRPNASPITHSSPKDSPTTAYPPSQPSHHLQYFSSMSPVTSHASNFTRVSPSIPYRPSSASPAPSYTPPPIPALTRPLSRSSPPPPRSPVIPPAESTRFPSAPSPPAPPPALPPVVQISEPQTQTRTLKPRESTAMDVDDERSFEDELLSLVDGEDSKPKMARSVSQFASSDPPDVPATHKPSGPSSKPVKPKAPLKPRAPTKSAKAKVAVKQASATGTPVPTSSMPPPSPPPAKQQPRPKGKGTGAKKKVASTGVKRSRSLSLKPPEPTPTPAPEVEMAREDDRLYCVCRTPYDEDKIMIACDRCDEWYHPACVGMPEVEVDLVDQYICVSCGKQKIGLQTTYKRRCHRGLKYIALHDTLPTCWKPARGAFSKYCSDDCGVAHMRAKILESGRDAASLWPVVKNARRREGVTVTNGPVKKESGEEMEVERKKAALMEARKVLKEADERELAELLRRLDDIMNAREACKAALERVMTRRRLLDLAAERATGRFCGWDLRLEMNDDEWTGWVTSEEGRNTLEGRETDDEEQWWCQGPEKCPRHSGWQNIRDLDVQVEVDSQNSNIKQLTDRERELRRRIEDINPPSAPVRQHGRSGGRKKNQGKRSAR